MRVGVVFLSTVRPIYSSQNLQYNNVNHTWHLDPQINNNYFLLFYSVSHKTERLMHCKLHDANVNTKLFFVFGHPQIHNSTLWPKKINMMYKKTLSRVIANFKDPHFSRFFTLNMNYIVFLKIMKAHFSNFGHRKPMLKIQTKLSENPFFLGCCFFSIWKTAGRLFNLNICWFLQQRTS
jgi:hypothetical protein